MTHTQPKPLTLPPAPDDNRFRLLLVEDDDEAARLILGLLERTGFACGHARDAESGMAAFNESQPHLLLAQNAGQEVDGAAFCRWAREKSGIPILMIGPTDESAEVAAFKFGADDYLSQPLRPAILMARVVAHLRRAYRFNAPPAPPANPFGLPVAEDAPSGTLPSGWAECDQCGYAGPRAKFEKKNVFDEIKMTCPAANRPNTSSLA
jgi:DNA-binding response OmpR family regulator